MKRYLHLIFAFFAVLGLAASAGATTYSLGNLNNLDHYYAYGWGATISVPSNEQITGASIFFDNIRNWDNAPNILWVNLLDNQSVGLSTYWDNQSNSNFFAGWTGIEINKYENLSTIAQDLTYTFDASEIIRLRAYAADGNFGLGIDPDCHFYNDGITLIITTSPVPEPASLLLLGTGLSMIGLAAWRRKK